MEAQRPRHLLIALCLLGTMQGGQAASWPDHLYQASRYVAQIQPDNNSYGSPALLSQDPAGTLFNRSKCGSFVALLLKNSYPQDITNNVLIALTGSSSPYADEWFAAIADEVEDPVSGLAFRHRARVADIQPGDIMASAYEATGDTGHALVVGEIQRLTTGTTPPFPIPGVSSVNRYQMLVYDATKSIHGDYVSSTPDSRYKKQWNGTTWVADQGLGAGYIALYEDAASGLPVAWAWNTSKTTSSFYYAVTPPPGTSLSYRPLAFGAIAGI